MKKNTDFLPEGTLVLSLADPDFVEQLAAAIGADSMDKFQFITPTFHRQNDITPVLAEAGVFKSLVVMGEETARECGLQLWDKNLWLFPVEWYNSIPEGFVVESISQKIMPFSKATHGPDCRFGALAYGVRITAHDVNLDGISS